MKTPEFFEGMANGVVGPCLFGKHPCWADHMDDMNFDHRALAHFKQKFYVEMISHAIGRGYWKKAEMDGELPWNHTLYGLYGDAWITARAMASQDAKGRGQYPLMAAKAGKGQETEVEWIRSGDSVSLVTQKALELTSLNTFSTWAKESLSVETPTINSVAKETLIMERDENGTAERSFEEWLARISRALQGVKDGMVWVRVPISSANGQCAPMAWLSLWEKLDPNPLEMRWAVHRDLASYVDLIYGFNPEGAWRGLFSSPEEQALASEIPYQLTQEEISSVNRAWEDWKAQSTWLPPASKVKNGTFWSRIFGS